MVKRRVLDRLKTLEKGAQRLGEGELGLQVSIGRPDEIGHLAAAFNDMSRRLADSRIDADRLQRLDAIDQVVNSVNHEINNPLMAISGNAEIMLAAERNLGPESRHRLSAILLEVQRIAQVTQQLRSIREPISEPYLDYGSRMIDLARATHYHEKETTTRKRSPA
jgi:signal transduction histidine kinase